METIHHASNTDNSTADENPSTPNASLSYFRRTVSLRDWWLIMAENDFEGKRFAVAGLTSQEKQAVRVFSSAPILRRHEMLVLETVDGVYVLIGSCINKDRTKENGFPSEVIDRFFCGFPTYWEEYAEKCSGKEFSNKDVSTSLAHDKLSTDSGSVDEFSEGTADRNKSDVGEERHGTSDKMDLTSEGKGQHKPQDGACNESSLEDPKLCSSQVVSEMIIDGASKGFDSQNHVTDCFTVGAEFQVSALLESQLPKSSDVEDAHGHKTTSSMNLRSSSKRSDTPKRNDKIPVSPKEESFPTGTVVEAKGTKIPEITENIMQDSMGCPNRDMNSNPTTVNPKRRIKSRLKNLRNPKNTKGDDKKLNTISAAGTARSVRKRETLEGISLSGGRTSNSWPSKMKSKLKDDQKNVNSSEYEENGLNCCSRGKYDNLSNAAVNGERKFGCISTFIPSGVGLQPADGETEQLNGYSTSQAGKRSKNTKKALRSSIGLIDANQIGDFQITASKKKAKVESASKSREKTKRKLTYGTLATKGGTEKISFVSPESLSFRRSRSGRLLLPTLEFWRNQLAVYDADRQITGIQGLCDVEPS